MEGLGGALHTYTNTTTIGTTKVPRLVLGGQSLEKYGSPFFCGRKEGEEACCGTTNSDQVFGEDLDKMCFFSLVTVCWCALYNFPTYAASVVFQWRLNDFWRDCCSLVLPKAPKCRLQWPILWFIPGMGTSNGICGTRIMAPWDHAFFLGLQLKGRGR